MFLPAFDPTYYLLMLPPLVLGLVASVLLNYWTGKYMKENTSRAMTGIEIAEKIASARKLEFKVNLISQVLGESWDPTTHTLNLSQDTAYGKSVTAAGIVAHELGHVEQQQSGSLLFKLRSGMVPLVNLGTNIGYFMIVIGLILQFTELSWIGIAFFSLATVFSLLTLPIELDASKRALNMLTKEGIIFQSETGGVKKVLTAAALTYVAALFQSIGQLLYFVFRVQGLGRRDSD